MDDSGDEEPFVGDEAGSDGEQVLEEDLVLEEAAGSGDDEDDEPGEEEEESDQEEELGEEREARPEGLKEDPLLRASNRSQITIIIPPDERKTSNCLQKTEAASLIATRAAQIAATGVTFLVGGANHHNPVVLATRELYERRFPIKRRRPVGRVGEALAYEEWDPNEMSLPSLPDF
jgi:DNA-directed RNA polymerase subunit K/omega